MADEEWIKTLADGRNVKFVYQELPNDGAFWRSLHRWLRGSCSKLSGTTSLKARP
jgi:hypothetical protein